MRRKIPNAVAQLVVFPNFRKLPRVLFVLAACLVSCFGASNNNVVARRLAEKAATSRQTGEMLRAFLLYSEAAKIDPDNQTYLESRDSLAPIAGLLIKTELEDADISEDLAEAKASLPAAPAALRLENQPVGPAPQKLAMFAEPAAAKEASAVPTVVPAETEPEAAPPADSAAADAVRATQESNLPTDLSVAVRVRQDAAISARAPFHLTENRTYAYFDLAYDFWTAANGKYKIRFGSSVRSFYDSAYDASSFYSNQVKADEHFGVELRRAVLTFAGPSWTIHVGRQQVVWGEAVGMFIADVVNPKDYRQFLVPDLDDVRIPLAALDVEKTWQHWGKLELFWSPDVKTSRLPVNGSEFNFFTPSFGGLPVDYTTAKPARRLGNSSVGIRYSRLTHGWDSSVFYLRSISDLPTATSTSLGYAPNPFIDALQVFPMVDHFAATTSKPLGDFVLKGEAIYSRGTEYALRTLGPALRRDTVSAMLGFSYPLCCQYMLDVQYFQNSLLGSTGQLYEPGLRSGFSVRVADVASLRRIKPSLQAVGSVNQHDYWLSPRLNVRLTNSLFAALGFDWFAGNPETQFGQFRDASRLEMSLIWKTNYAH